MALTVGQSGQAARARGTLLLADISGYTGFLQGVADAHHALILEADEPPVAYALMSSLLDAMVTAVVPPFRLAKFEGDAIFAVAPDPEFALRGADVLACLRACHGAFTARLAEANSLWTCTCGSCARVHELGLKFVLHHGDYVVQPIAGREELLGPEVNIAHRLLKNHAIDEWCAAVSGADRRGARGSGCLGGGHGRHDRDIRARPADSRPRPPAGLGLFSHRRWLHRGARHQLGSGMGSGP